jgi:sulfatase maturation enzyme AslB (radical SAM superfamily)
MTFDTARQFIDQILDEDKKISEYCDFDNSIGFIINFIGGEPFLEINLITEISKYCLGKMFKMKHPKILKFMFNICSNGLNHFNPTVQEYLKTFDGYCSYSISIDGHKNLHDACRLDLNGEGTYDRVVLAVKDYLKTHEYIGNKMTLSPNNITHTYEAVKSLLELGYRDIYFNCVYEKGWTNEHATILYYQLKDIILYLKEQNLLNSVMLSMFSLQIGDKLDPKEN